MAVLWGSLLQLPPQGWQKIDWNAVPPSLRDSENRNAPVVTLRAQKSAEPLDIDVERHSLADALKLRVKSGTLLTVLSPKGDTMILCKFSNWLIVS